MSTYCKSFVLNKVDAVGYSTTLTYGDNTLPDTTLDEIILTLSLLNSSKVFDFKSPPYSLTCKILPVIPKVEIKVCKP